MDTIVIYDGLSGEHKLDATISKFNICGDIVQSTTSSVTISEADKVNVGDIWYILDDYSLSGTVASVDTNVYTSNQSLTLYVGSDVYVNDILMEDNTLVPNLQDDNEQPYLVSVQGSVSVTATDNLLGLDVLSRQLMRSQPCTRNMYQTGCFILYDSEPEVIEFRLDDPSITVENIFFADDQFNALRLYNTDDLGDVATYYMQSDNSVSTSQDFSLVKSMKSMKVGADEWNSLSYASSVLKSQNYNNEIEFTIKSDNNIGIKHDETILGKKVTVHIEGYNPLDSIISGYEISDMDNIKITLGLSRSRMSDYINKEV